MAQEFCMSVARGPGAAIAEFATKMDGSLHAALAKTVASTPYAGGKKRPGVRAPGPSDFERCDYRFGCRQSEPSPGLSGAPQDGLSLAKGQADGAWLTAVRRVWVGEDAAPRAAHHAVLAGAAPSCRSINGHRIFAAAPA